MLGIPCHFVAPYCVIRSNETRLYYLQNLFSFILQSDHVSTQFGILHAYTTAKFLVIDTGTILCGKALLEQFI